MTATTMPRKHYSDVQLDDVVYAHGVPFVVTGEPRSYPHGNGGPAVVWTFRGTYRGPDLGSWHDGNPLGPFVTRDGDTWTFQIREDLAYVVRHADGTWHAP